MKLNRKRLYFFGAHLAISFIIFLVLMYQILYNWYPHNLFYTSGGWHGTKIVFFVDMVLGPAITLILASPAKQNKELIRDLFFCAVIQICALTYGVSLVVNNRPIALSIHDGAIYTVMQEDIKNIPDKTFFFNSAQQPPLVYSEDASRYDVRNAALMSKARKMLAYSREFNVPMYAIPDIFDDIESRQDELTEVTIQSLQKIKKSKQYNEIQFQKMKHKNLFVIPIDGSFTDGYIAFDKNGRIEGSICCH